jgi:hypothetical protein
MMIVIGPSSASFRENDFREMIPAKPEEALRGLGNDMENASRGCSL